MTKRPALFLLAVVVLLLAVGVALYFAVADGGVDRDTYVQRNERVFESLPRFPGATVKSETSGPYRDGESGPIVGYTTVFELDLPDDSSFEGVAAFFRRRLRGDWRLVEQDEAVLNFRRERSSVSINLENERRGLLEIAVDHAYYGKLGR